MMGLSDGRKSFPIGLAVLIQYQSVIASHPASHVAVAITLNAKASSLKNRPNLCIIGDAILHQTGAKLTKNAVLNLALCCGAI